MERLQYAPEEERTRILEELHAPSRRRDPEQVSQDVVDEEMSLFFRAAGQNSTGGA